MECKKCGKKIEDFEIYCNECKKILKSEKELDTLITENKELNKLEITKEVETLKDFKDEKNEEHSTLKEELKDIVNIEHQESNPVGNNKRIIIIVSSIIGILIISAIIISIILLNNKEVENIEEPETINYENIINEYGDSVKLALSKYLADNEQLPSWFVISDLIEYSEYAVVCNTHNIYKDGNIYLNDCKIDGEEVNYSYGIEQEEEKEGKKIEIYKVNYDNNSYSYTSSNQQNSELVGFITCETENCGYVNAYDKYILIKENNEYYIYNYETNFMEFGPFNIVNDYYENNILEYNYTLYGILYNENDKQNIYNINTGKTLKNIEGELLSPNMYISPNIMYKYGYVPLKKDEENKFLNLKTGNISYTINGYINTFVEDSKNDIVYITTFNSENSKIKLYNSNGKKLFDGKEYNDIQIYEGNLIVSDDNNFYVYDSKLKQKVSSKKYDSILDLNNGFIVVIDNSYLEIVDSNDKILATFDLKWDSKKYKFHSALSGWYTENGKNGIYLVVENLDPTEGGGFEYYYIPETSEIGFTEMEQIGGYAKPVLYLYPEKKTNITVKFSNPELLTTTYPKFNTEWNVVAHPNGDLYDINNKYYYGLYWEEDLNHFVDFSEGFYVEKENAIEFLEEKLDIIGLNDKERNEFIMYWLPILEKNKKNLVYFELTEERDSYNKLLINPSPDSILRMAIHVKKVNKKTAIKEQHLTRFERKGFTAVEWGGVSYK